MSTPGTVKSLKEIAQDNLPKIYVFKCYRNRTVVVGYKKEEAITKLYLALSNQIKNLGNKFSIKKCFGTTLFQRTEMFMVLKGEKNSGIGNQLDIIESPDFLSRERLEKLVENGMIKMEIFGLNNCLNILEADWPSDSDDEKYTTY